jgi:GTPase SAR1 family protein
MNEESLCKLENELVIHHPIFEDVVDDVLRVVQYGRKDSIISVLGPTGVGKTTLIRHLLSYLVERQKSGWRKDMMPPLAVEAPEGKKEFPWAVFLSNILIALGEVQTSNKIDVNEIIKSRQAGEKTPSRRSPSIANLEGMLKTRIRSLRPVCIFIDEAQNIVAGFSDSEIKSNMNRLKYWANQLETKIITFGTHEAKPLLAINEQLGRRVKPIYFPRYQWDSNETEYFSQFYKALIIELDIAIDIKVRDDFTYIYNHSLGCPGILSGWLHDAIGHCISKNLKSISRRTLEKTRMPYDSLLQAEKSIKEFEEYYRSSLAEFDPALVVLDEGSAQDLTLHKNPKTTGHKPGKKNPLRYPVGEI